MHRSVLWWSPIRNNKSTWGSFSLKSLPKYIWRSYSVLSLGVIFLIIFHENIHGGHFPILVWGSFSYGGHFHGHHIWYNIVYLIPENFHLSPIWLLRIALFWILENSASCVLLNLVHSGCSIFEVRNRAIFLKHYLLGRLQLDLLGALKLATLTLALQFLLKQCFL